MKQKLIVAVIAISLCCLLIASLLSIHRAKQLPEQPSSDPGEENFEMQYVEYTGKAHEGTGIAYRGSGANANYVIVIDAGHQARAMSETEPNGPGSDVMKAKVTGGTQGTLTGLAEYELNLRVALALRDVLIAQGYSVVMVRETHEVEISNAERAQLANRVGAAVNIRIHANGDANASLTGAMTICQTSANPYNASIYEECRALSEAVLASYCSVTGMGQRSVWETDTMTGTNWAQVPTTIVEMGFMTNAEDEAAMATEGFAALAAEGIAQGIAQYLKSSQTEEQSTEQQTGTETQTPTTEAETQAPVTDYEIDLDMEERFGLTFTEVYVIMQATGNVWVRSEPSSAQGMDTVVSGLQPEDRVVCVGLGNGWNRVLIDGKVYYVSAAYLEEASE